jgi:hypothetical protein
VRLGKVCERFASPPQGKKQDSGRRKAVERDPALWSFLNGDVGNLEELLNFGETNPRVLYILHFIPLLISYLSCVGFVVVELSCVE